MLANAYHASTSKQVLQSQHRTHTQDGEAAEANNGNQQGTTETHGTYAAAQNNQARRKAKHAQADRQHKTKTTQKSKQTNKQTIKTNTQTSKQAHRRRAQASALLPGGEALDEHRSKCLLLFLGVLQLFLEVLPLFFEVLPLFLELVCSSCCCCCWSVFRSLAVVVGTLSESCCCFWNTFRSLAVVVGTHFNFKVLLLFLEHDSKCLLLLLECCSESCCHFWSTTRSLALVLGTSKSCCCVFIAQQKTRAVLSPSLEVTL
jgi:hypothetical protein